MAAIVWFKYDLRCCANPALTVACRQHESVIPLFILDTTQEVWPLGSAAQWWLHQSLKNLQTDLQKNGLNLILRSGNSVDIITALVEEKQVTAVYWNRRYEPSSIEHDKSLKSRLNSKGVQVASFNGSLLNEPWEILKKDKTPYRVFTSYWKESVSRGLAGADASAEFVKNTNTPRITSLTLEDLKLLPKIDWYNGFHKYWNPGEKGALKALDKFIQEGLSDYADTRDRPAITGTSRLSPHLHFGEISPRQIVSAIRNSENYNTELYLRQLVWRDFAHHLLFYFPHSDHAPLNDSFKSFKWRDHYQHDLMNWQNGITGIPLVDAGMRELWHTGWMHNRTRMVVASFLTKNLLIPWQEGAKWFWDTLLDADLANNSMGWQWVAGSGADAAPYFRVFNPVLQSQKFDPDGVYLRTWLPELTHLPNKYIHAPWQAPANVLDRAGISLGIDYPEPIVDLKQTRERALNRYQKLRSKRKEK